MKSRLKRSHIFILMVVLSFALIQASNVPGVLFFGRILLLFSTLAHEIGHGFAAILMGGHFDKMTIEWDASGLAHSSYQPGRLRQAFVSAGGLVGPAIAAAGLFWAARGNDNRLRVATSLLGITLCLVGVFAARSPMALIYTLGLGPLILVASAQWNRKLLEAATVFIAVQLGFSVFTRADYLFTRWAGPDVPSDVAAIASQLFLPYWFWGLLCGALSVVVLFWGFRCYTRET